jgi:hypothetical protein
LLDGVISAPDLHCVELQVAIDAEKVWDIGLMSRRRISAFGAEPAFRE